MKAVMCKTFGPPSSLVIEEIDDPVPGPGDVVVDIAATGLNFFDTLIIRDKYQVKPPMPFSPGAEFAGTVSAVGDNVKDIAVGDRVAATVTYGAACEKIALPANSVAKIPDGVSFDTAAGLLIAYGTTLHALKDRGDLKPGETLAVLGASGGVGLAAVEIGHIMGAKVIACASSDEKLDICKAHGADIAVNYAKTPVKDALKEIGGEAGIDVIYDPVGGEFAEAALRAIAWEGRFLVIGFAAGEIPKIPLNLTLLKGCDIRGVFWGRFTKIDPDRNRANNQQLLDWCAEGKLKVPLHGAYKLDDIASALEAFERREVVGKVVLHP